MENKLFCATVMYPYTEGVTFDFDSYANIIIPEYISIIGDNCAKYEIRKSIPLPGGANPAFICVCNVWLKDMSVFEQLTQTQTMKNVMKKIADFTTIVPVRLLDQVV
jgi:uncharacterized protein (TIGR02118 family)